MKCPQCGLDQQGYFACRSCLQKSALKDYQAAAERHRQDILNGAFLSVRRKVKGHGLRHVALPNHPQAAFCGQDMKLYIAVPEEFNLREIRASREMCPECVQALEALLEGQWQKKAG